MDGKFDPTKSEHLWKILRKGRAQLTKPEIVAYFMWKFHLELGIHLHDFMDAYNAAIDDYSKEEAREVVMKLHSMFEEVEKEKRKEMWGKNAQKRIEARRAWRENSAIG